MCCRNRDWIIDLGSGAVTREASRALPETNRPEESAQCCSDVFLSDQRRRSLSRMILLIVPGYPERQLAEEEYGSLQLGAVQGANVPFE